MRRPDGRQLVNRKPSALSIRRQCALLGIAARDLVRQLDRQIPRPQDPDLLTTSFLSSADVEPDDDISSVPTVPVRLDHPAATEPPSTTAGTHRV